MTDASADPRAQADDLLALDGPAPPDTLLEELLARERDLERRLRRAATGAWGAVLALVPLLGCAFFLVRTGAGLSVELARAGGVVCGILAILALFLAVVLTVAWLARGRAASLAAIERRLAALERRLLTDRGHRP